MAMPRGWRRNYRTFSRCATSRQATPIVAGATPGQRPVALARAVSCLTDRGAKVRNGPTRVVSVTLASRRAHYAAENPCSTARKPLSRMAVETLAFILHNLPAIGERTVEHISIVGVAVGIAILTGVPLGIAITQSQRTADTVLYLGSIVMTIPSIALFGVLIPLLSKIGQGIGYLPAVIAAMLYAQLPIVRNTYTAIRNVDPALRSAAIGMGMSTSQRLLRVEIPIALPVIIAGVRIAVVINIGVTAIAAYIGAGGLGTFISRGISQTDVRQLITGALALALLAIAADYALLWLQRRLTPKGAAARTG
jgi:osmoprotectant transport system permease protein